jgi:hypothetical protein
VVDAHIDMALTVSAIPALIVEITCLQMPQADVGIGHYGLTMIL